jgi:choline kinase
MKALILVAGQGRRLWPFTRDCPKCLLSIGGRSILEQQLSNLEQAGIRQVVLVCGFGVDSVRRAAAAYAGTLHIKIVYNPFYSDADNLISLWAARCEMDQDFVLLNGDNVFHPRIVELLLEEDEMCCLMIDRKSFYDDDDMKLRLESDRIRLIGKSLLADSADAESIGIMQFAGAGVRELRQVLEEAVLEERSLSDCFLNCIQRLIDHDFPVKFRDIGGLPWTDVDTPEDLRMVRRNLPVYQSEAALYALRNPVYEKAKGGA